MKIKINQKAKFNLFQLCSNMAHNQVNCNIIFTTLKLKEKFLIHLDPLHPNIGMHILHTVLYTFPKVLTRRICLTVKSFYSW